MQENQHTIQSPASVTGKGLHTGHEVTMTFKPAPENHGYVFKRTDVEGQPLVHADVDNVVDTSRGTTIAENGTKVHTVEHTLAALAGLQIDNVLIELDGPEPPVMDGSSAFYMQALKSAGIVQQDAPREYFIIDQPVHFQGKDRQSDIVALPDEGFRATVIIDFDSEVLGHQQASLARIEDFEKEIAPNRTFCFLHELEQLVAAGLIKGGDLNNAVVVVERELSEEDHARLAELFKQPKIEVRKGYLNNLELRFDNEPARHKLLDLVGDLALAGAPIKGQILATRPGHSANVAFAKQIKALIKQQKLKQKYQGKDGEDFVFDVNAIQNILPHRYPFLMVDRITRFAEDEIHGYKNVTVNEPFFQGHFPGNPIMPGVMQLEAMAQVGGIMLLNKIENPENYWVYFVAIDNARFKKMVVPGDQLVFKLEMINFRRNICKMSGQGFVGDKLACSAELTAALVQKETAPAKPAETRTTEKV